MEPNSNSSWDNFPRGFSCVGAQQKKTGILELFWLPENHSEMPGEKKTSTQLQKSSVSYFFSVFFFQATVTVMY